MRWEPNTISKLLVKNNDHMISRFENWSFLTNSVCDLGENSTIFLKRIGLKPFVKNGSLINLEIDQKV